MGWKPDLAGSLLAALAAVACTGEARADLAAGRAAFEQHDYARAYAQLMPEAQGGNGEAEYLIGVMAANGLGMARSYAVAERWYALAAKAGYGPANLTLGLLYLHGGGEEGEPTAVAADPAKAAPFIRAAADAGDKDAQALMGELYLQGRGVRQDLERAREYTLKAAMRGVIGAQFDAGMMALRGWGAPPDPIEAYKWFSLAAGAQYPGAEENRRRIADGLDPAQLAQAEAQVKSFQPAP